MERRLFGRTSNPNPATESTEKANPNGRPRTIARTRHGTGQKKKGLFNEKKSRKKGRWRFPGIEEPVGYLIKHKFMTSNSVEFAEIIEKKQNKRFSASLTVEAFGEKRTFKAVASSKKAAKNAVCEEAADWVYENNGDDVPPFSPDSPPPPPPFDNLKGFSAWSVQHQISASTLEDIFEDAGIIPAGSVDLSDLSEKQRLIYKKVHTALCNNGKLQLSGRCLRDGMFLAAITIPDFREYKVYSSSKKEAKTYCASLAALEAAQKFETMDPDDLRGLMPMSINLGTHREALEITMHRYKELRKRLEEEEKKFEPMELEPMSSLSLASRKERNTPEDEDMLMDIDAPPDSKSLARQKESKLRWKKACVRAKAGGQFQKMREARNKLPMLKYSSEILESISEGRLVIIRGDTGSGKSTQVPQIILEDAELKGTALDVNIVITQPRRVAAITCARRVAEERGEKVGESVGFHVRFQRKLPRRGGGSILFCTDGMLLAKARDSGFEGMSGVTHLIVDETHERSVEIDLLLALIKDTLKMNSKLKVVVMSATLNSRLFAEYFKEFNPIKLEIPGRMFPVKVHYPKDSLKILSPYLEESVCREIEISEDVMMYNPTKQIRIISSYILAVAEYSKRTTPGGAVLVFLPSWELISGIMATLQKEISLNVLPLHSSLPPDEQVRVFKPAPEGKHTVILATNIAETSLTIQNVRQVVDLGLRKNVKRSGSRIFSSVHEISQSQAAQRKGRAGRVAPGECFRMYSESTLQNFWTHNPPEIANESLENLVLRWVLGARFLQTRNQGNEFSKPVPGDRRRTMAFLSTLIEPPLENMVETALSNLFEIGAIDDCENLNPLGKALSRLPVDAKYGKMLLYGRLLGCGNSIEGIVPMLEIDPVILPFEQNLKHEARTRQIAASNDATCDYIRCLNILRNYKSQTKRFKWAHDNWLSGKKLQTVTKMESQIKGVLDGLKLPKGIDRNTDNEENLIRAVVAVGLLPQVAWTRKPNTKSFTHDIDLKVQIHPASVLKKRKMSTKSKKEGVLFLEKRYTEEGSCLLWQCTQVSPMALCILSSTFVLDRNYSRAWLGNEIVEGEVEELSLIVDLRDAFERITQAWLRGFEPYTEEREVINIVAQLLAEESLQSDAILDQQRIQIKESDAMTDREQLELSWRNFCNYLRV